LFAILATIEPSTVSLEKVYFSCSGQPDSGEHVAGDVHEFITNCVIADWNCEIRQLKLRSPSKAPGSMLTTFGKTTVDRAEQPEKYNKT